MQHYYLYKYYKILFFIFFVSCATSFEIKEENYIEEGLASWYGKEYHGQKTSSGEIFNMYDLTAAHRTLPFGTIVDVYSYDTNKTVKVRINDRGPFLPKRIIDLSYQAAKELGILNIGIAKVKIISKEKPKETKEEIKIVIQVGAFKNKENAENLLKKLKEKYQNVYTEDFNEFKRVLIGPFNDEVKIEKVFNSLIKDGFTPIIRKI
jgi:rare lipoprotein A